MDRSTLGGSLKSALIALALIAMGGCGSGGGSDSSPVVVGGGTVGTGTAMLSWTPPTTNEDGTPVELRGFNVYQGSSPQNLQLVRSVSDIDTTVLIEGLAEGEHYFAVKAVSLNGVESAFSNIASKLISS